VFKAFKVKLSEQFEKLLHTDDLIAEWQGILGLLPSLQLEECLNKTA